eukprot:CAMPEP_0185695666 /NCGR_PEP_ID=MMETSP1164-20130828/4661_1 /TAXON_ID=1104430 /ORGANISM="Chrysoreinhardia sp, Strain CCMP2950" /LENGTH=332 /DNA_ID=CAMNT_0028362527 /DNA_START=17 /DNA_END=1012 /DNA_ORIENTATION=+
MMASDDPKSSAASSSSSSSEFFVVEVCDVSDRVRRSRRPALGPPPPADATEDPARASSSSAVFWRSRYRLRLSAVPSFIPEARRIFDVGKARNFLKHQCGGGVDTQKGGAAAVVSAADDEDCFRYGEEARLAALTRRLSRETNARLADALLRDARLMDHLATLRACLLLAQGDFAAGFVERLEPLGGDDHGGMRGRTRRRGSSSAHDDRSSSFAGAVDALLFSQHAARHDAWTAFDAAVRGSNAALCPTIDAVRVALSSTPSPDPGDPRATTSSASRTTPHSSSHPAASLDYEPPAPVDAVVDDGALRVYRAANVAFLRRAAVAHRLNRTWR